MVLNFTMECKWIFFILTTNIFACVVSENFSENGNNTSGFEGSDVLSRRKRFLIFPDGSSLQLVFCLQTSALIPIGDIFLYSSTAALAWNLPTDPTFFDNLKKKEKANKRMDQPKMIAYVDELGKVIGRVPYRRKTIINPAFAKRSIRDNHMTFKEKLKLKKDRIRMQTQWDFLKKDGLDPKSIELHRNSRRELFGKLETLLTAMGRNGRQCVLYKLCEAAQRAGQGTFIQEFIRAVFTLPKGTEFGDEYHREYDKAHSPTDDCEINYTGCIQGVSD